MKTIFRDYRINGKIFIKKDTILTFTYSKSAIKTLERGVKYVQS